MINGAPSDDSKSDGGDAPSPSPVSSQYSSCGESEFERYCSANSALGTPSVCSSSYRTFNECVESEFESVRSFGDGVLENFSLGGGLDRNLENSGVSSSQSSNFLGDERNGLNLYGDEEGIVGGRSEIGDGVLEDFSLGGGVDCNLEDSRVSSVQSSNFVGDERNGLNLYGDEEGVLGGRSEIGGGVLGNLGLGGGVDCNLENRRVLSMQRSNFVGGGRIGRENFDTKKSGLNLYGDEEVILGGRSEMAPLKIERGLEFRDSDLHKRGGCVEDDIGGWRGDDELGNVRSLVENVSANDIDGNMFSGEVENGSHFVPGDGGNSGSCVVSEGMESGSHEFNLDSGLQFEGRGVGSFCEEDESSSRYEHSEGEDSMFNYGSDDEKKSGLYHGRSIQYQQEVRKEDRNPLLMGSSVAFGSEDWDDFLLETGEGTVGPVAFNWKEQKLETEENLPNTTSVTATGVQSFGGLERRDDVKDIPEVSSQAQDADELADNIQSCSINPDGYPIVGEPTEQSEAARDISVTSNEVRGADESAGYQGCSISSCTIATELQTHMQKDTSENGLNVMNGSIERDHQYVITEKLVGLDDSQVSETQELWILKLQADPLSNNTMSQLCSPPTEAPKHNEAKYFEAHKPFSLPSMVENDRGTTMKDSSVMLNLSEDHPLPIKTENLELNESYDEVVHDMEEILLDSSESPGITQSNRIFQSQLALPLRDGGSTASTSGTDDAYLLIQHPPRIDGVEVVGAKQKRGDVSLGERLVGVKEYTVYKIRVWSGNDQWEVERRYRDFYTLFRQLKTFFSDHGWVLPSPWSSVEQESRKIFGNASPDVVADRSVLIQDCLRSILHSRISSSLPSALIWFLSPQNSLPSSPASNILLPWSKSVTIGEGVSTLGKTISLIVEIRPYKSVKQLLDAQHYACAGCHQHFYEGMTMMRDFVQSLGWGKPRLCEYTGQLFCSSCHSNDTAVLPARVLHHWDFTQYPVSQLAKSYLDSIHDQPMLCVSAVNPFLFSKVPALLHVMNVRKKVGAMIPYVRCPFRRSINKGLRSRRYLLESNDFFALRDLIDLSKGIFAALPVMVETLSRKILEHITEQCLICCDVGVPCGARQACNDPSSLIFPFQEDDVESCKSCQSVFHKPCFGKLKNCQCGACLRVEEATESTKRIGHRVEDEDDGTLHLIGRKLGSALPGGFLSGIFSTARQEKFRHRDSDTVILMGSLPSNYL